MDCWRFATADVCCSNSWPTLDRHAASPPALDAIQPACNDLGMKILNLFHRGSDSDEDSGHEPIAVDAVAWYRGQLSKQELSANCYLKLTKYSLSALLSLCLASGESKLLADCAATNALTALLSSLASHDAMVLLSRRRDRGRARPAARWRASARRGMRGG